MPANILSLRDSNLAVSGYIDNSFSFMSDKSIMIVPLFSGSGMRVKILEGMACGKTIISTTIGAEGIDYTANVDILIADTAEDFIKTITNCLKNPDLCKTIGENAIDLIRRKYSIQNTCNHLIRILS